MNFNWFLSVGKLRTNLIYVHRIPGAILWINNCTISFQTFSKSGIYQILFVHRFAILAAHFFSTYILYCCYNRSLFFFLLKRIWIITKMLLIRYKTLHISKTWNDSLCSCDELRLNINTHTQKNARKVRRIYDLDALVN